MKILFVCTGNMCRSPMAEGIANKLAEERGIENIEFESAGTGSIEGALPSQNAVLVCREIGVDISGHLSKPLTTALLRECDIAFGMEHAHIEYARSLLPNSDIKIELLGRSADGKPREIPDPIGKGIEDYREARDEIIFGLKAVFEGLDLKK